MLARTGAESDNHSQPLTNSVHMLSQDKLCSDLERP